MTLQVSFLSSLWSQPNSPSLGSNLEIQSSHNSTGKQDSKNQTNIYKNQNHKEDLQHQTFIITFWLINFNTYSNAFLNTGSSSIIYSSCTQSSDDGYIHASLAHLFIDFEKKKNLSRFQSSWAALLSSLYPSNKTNCWLFLIVLPIGKKIILMYWKLLNNTHNTVITFTYGSLHLFSLDNWSTSVENTAIEPQPF